MDEAAVSSGRIQLEGGLMRKFLKWLFITVGGGFLLLIIIFIVALASGNGSGSPSANLTASMKDTAIVSIQAYPEVKDAAISQDRNSISLVIVVAAATSPERAQELGENFVRMVKTFSPDTAPGNEIGIGVYDYLIGVYYPNEHQVALGAKSRGAKRISW